MNQLTRRDFLRLCGTSSIGLALAACGVTPTPTATPAPTNTALPTNTPIPTNTPPPTATATLTNTPAPTNTATPTATPTVTATPRLPTLRDLANKMGLEIGLYTDPRIQKAKEIAESEFNLLIVWPYWVDQMPRQGQLDFRWPDTQLAVALQGNMQVRFQHLLFPNDMPAWLNNGTFSREQLIRIVRDIIAQTMTHYQGKVKQWVVVNEPYILPYRPKDVFYKQIGPDYIDIAFQIARETDPSGILIYNDFDNHSSSGITTQLTRETVQRLKSKRLIDGVGLQMHLDGSTPPNKQDVIATMQSYGVPVYVTEFDVNLKDVKGTQVERFAKQAQIYKGMMEACIESRVCRSFSFWDIGDKYSVLEACKACYGYSPDSAPTLYDDDLNPKPAYFAIRDVLAGKP